MAFLLITSKGSGFSGNCFSPFLTAFVCKLCDSRMNARGRSVGKGANWADGKMEEYEYREGRREAVAQEEEAVVFFICATLFIGKCIWMRCRKISACPSVLLHGPILSSKFFHHLIAKS